MSSQGEIDLALLSLSALNSLTAQIAVLNVNGVILKVNSAWTAFTLENNGSQSLADGIGINYLEVCQGIHGSSADEALATYNGIRDVLAGEQQKFSLEYPCHSPTEQRWFLMTVTPFKETNDYVVVSHLDITQRKQAELLRISAMNAGLFGYTPDVLG